MWAQVWQRYKGRISGASAGIALSVVYLIKGFWDMLIVAFIFAVCYLLGRRFDENPEWFSFADISRQLADTWRRLMERWNMFR